MDNGFRKFKRKLCISAIVKSAITGLSLGVIVVAVLWLIAKLTTAQPDFLTYGLVGGGLALVVTGILLAILFPTDRRAAKHLDTKLELNEKVQTMIAFRKESGDMIQLQRDDTEQILQNAPAKKLRNKFAWTVAILPVLACACMVGTILVGAQEPEPPKPPVDPTWRLDQFSEQSMLDLIKHVQDSKMEEAPKADTVARLELLVEQLKNIKKASLMNDAVVDAISDIHETVAGYNTYSLVTGPMIRSSSEWVKRLGSSLNTMKAEEIEKYFAALAEAFGIGTEKTRSSEVTGEDRVKLAQDVIEGVKLVLDTTEESAEDPLYKALAAFVEKLDQITQDSTSKQVEDILEDAQLVLLEAVAGPMANVSEEKYVINRLMEIFGISAEDVPPEILEDLNNEITGDTKPDDDWEEKGNGGGLGDGAFKGADHEIYDPQLGRIVKLSEVLPKYLAIIDDYRNSGAIPEDMDKLLSTYFAFLTNFKDTETND